MSRLVNITYTDLAPDLLYHGSWFPTTWSAPAMHLNGTIHSTTDLAAAVSFTFPVPAVEFYYFGMRRSTGGMYTICTDNCSLPSSFTLVDAFNATDDDMNPPVVLYHESFPLPTIHNITLTNEFDLRGTPLGNSQLCVASFVLTVVITPSLSYNGSTSTPVSPVLPTQLLSNSSGSASGTTTTPAPFSASSSIAIPEGESTCATPSTTASATNTPASASETAAAGDLVIPEHQPAPFVVVAAVLGGLAAFSVCILLGFALVQRWRRRRNNARGYKRANATTYTSPMAYRPWGPVPPPRSGDAVVDRKMRLALADPRERAAGTVQGGGRVLDGPATPRVDPAPPAPAPPARRARVGRRLRGGGFSAVWRSVAGQRLSSIAETLPEYTDSM